MVDDKVVELFSNKLNPNLTDSATAEIELLQDAKALLEFIAYIELEANKHSFSEVALFIGAARISAEELVRDLPEDTPAA